MGRYMSGTSFTKNFTTALLTESVKLAWGLISVGQQGHESRGPLAMSRLYECLLLGGQALEGWTERTAERLGIDILDVLAPIAAARLGC
ncbi:hypothetical protein [Bradyrhizobium sp. ARR65]|uniref:hypothetical protein n=1 Tax=Bradyrhizobium sp. ARR65 TaxID=1040989 RepID=UPI000553731E|nr:hypothetical protein [Bradyrhizobium sp. ARR65]